MNQFLVPVLHIGRLRLRIALPWMLVALALGAWSGWAGATLISDSPSPPERALSSLVVVAGIVTAVAIRELSTIRVRSHTIDEYQCRVLYPLGPAPEGYSIPPSPAEELRASLVEIGVPLVTGLVGSAAIWGIAPDSPATRLGMAFTLTCFLVGAAHLLPAMPFSGGSLMRAVFWFLDGNHRNATRIVFLYGQVIAIAALGFGLFLLTWRTEMVVAGIWCVAIGFVVLNASREEFLRAHLISRASRIQAADAISGLNPTIRAAETLSNAIDILLEQRSNGPGLVRDRDRFVGVLTLRSVRGVPRSRWDELRTQDVMIPIESVEDTPPGASLLYSLRTQETSGSDAVLVRREGGEIAGLISADIAPRVLIRRAEERRTDEGTSETGRERPFSS